MQLGRKTILESDLQKKWSKWGNGSRHWKKLVVCWETLYQKSFNLIMKVKAPFFILLLPALALLMSGCGQTIRNLTPTEIPMNPSNIYTLSLEVREVDEGIVEGSLNPQVVIDGRARPMSRSSQGEHIWEYEFSMPPGRMNAVYYYDIEYDKLVMGVSRPRSLTIPSDGLEKFSLINRYVISLAANRGIVGSTIGLNGSGFRPSDQIFVGNTLATSVYYSPNALGFYVPHLPSSQNYEVVLRGVRGDITVGSFRIDPAEMQVLPASVSVVSGERSTLIFSIPTEAPAGGLPIYITTDIPESIILPEVVIPEGSKSTSVILEGGTPGIGVLAVEADGYSDLEIPVEVFN